MNAPPKLRLVSDNEVRIPSFVVEETTNHQGIPAIRVISHDNKIVAERLCMSLTSPKYNELYNECVEVAAMFNKIGSFYYELGLVAGAKNAK